jgi:hypothetical protein
MTVRLAQATAQTAVPTVAHSTVTVVPTGLLVRSLRTATAPLVQSVLPTVTAAKVLPGLTVLPMVTARLVPLTVTAPTV